MKKFVSLLLALCLVCLSAAVLAEENDITGDWYGTMYGMAAQLTLNEDGTYVLKVGEMEMPGTYELKDDGIVYMDEDPDPDNGFVFDGSSLVNEVQNVTFTREQVEVEEIVLAEADPEATVEAFAGEWICRYIVLSGMTFDITQVPFEQLGLDAIPTVTIEGTSVVINGIGMETITGTDPVEFEFKDGTLVFNLASLFGEIGEGFDLGSLTFVALQDGMISLDMEPLTETPLALFFERTEAAEEAPAA